MESAASGLRLTTRGLLRIGDLVARGGEMAGRQVVPKSWIDALRVPVIDTGLDPGYARLWYIGEVPAPGADRPLQFIAGFGAGGQRLFVCPEVGISVVAYLGLYDDWTSWVAPTRFFRELVMRNFERI